MNIISHMYDGKYKIDQLAEDIVVGDKLIAKGYVNATQMCKTHGKRLQHYFDNKNTKTFLEELVLISRDSGESPPYIVVRGNVAPSLQGTWVSLPVAMDLARLIDPKFAAWAMVTLSMLVQGDFAPLTAEAAAAQEKLTETWHKIRDAGIDTRNAVTDSIKSWYERNPGGTSCPEHAMYALVTDSIYRRLWNMSAKDIEAFLGCPRHQSRDYMSAECLRVLERAESLVVDFIDLDNMKPSDAVKAAPIRPSRVPLASK